MQTGKDRESVVKPPRSASPLITRLANLGLLLGIGERRRWNSYAENSIFHRGGPAWPVVFHRIVARWKLLAGNYWRLFTFWSKLVDWTLKLAFRITFFLLYLVLRIIFLFFQLRRSEVLRCIENSNCFRALVMGNLRVSISRYFWFLAFDSPVYEWTLLV